MKAYNIGINERKNTYSIFRRCRHLFFFFLLVKKKIHTHTHTHTCYGTFFFFAIFNHQVIWIPNFKLFGVTAASSPTGNFDLFFLVFYFWIYFNHFFFYSSSFIVVIHHHHNYQLSIVIVNNLSFNRGNEKKIFVPSFLFCFGVEILFKLVSVYNNLISFTVREKKVDCHSFFFYFFLFIWRVAIHTHTHTYVHSNMVMKSRVSPFFLGFTFYLVEILVEKKKIPFSLLMIPVDSLVFFSLHIPFVQVHSSSISYSMCTSFFSNVVLK